MKQTSEIEQIVLNHHRRTIDANSKKHTLRDFSSYSI